MNLTIDIGNTRTKVGVFSEMQLVEDWSVDRLSIVTVRKIIKQYKIQYSIVSSTKLISDKLLEVLKSQTINIVLGEQTKLPFKNNYTTPNTLGYDRIALIAGIQAKYPSQNNLVIGCGTCITYNFINKKMNLKEGVSIQD